MDTTLMIKGCLALHHQFVSIHALERKAEQLKREFEQHTNTYFDDGVEMVHLPALEVYFQLFITKRWYS